MDQQRDIYRIVADLLNELPAPIAEGSNVAAEARAWLKQQSSASPNVRQLAQTARDGLDALLRAVKGGRAHETLLDARVALGRYIAPGPEAGNDALSVQFAPGGGVTLVRDGRHFTISDEELELVREAVNTRKREVRKLQRRGLI
ncbi:MAG: hypothetical protein HC876_03305 [Chloroflexaceae bacterium]|nr:hypothetical protein [Chloroflexaceae bacterium]NJO04621.1 hypothetical protein [Chloroflexaceae bacterium]